MIFGFPRLTVPLTEGDDNGLGGFITRNWYRLLVQMAGVLGTINYGTASVATASQAVVLTMLVGQAVRIHAFDQSNSANNAVADAFYDGTTLTVSNLLTHGSGVTIASSGANLEVSNTSGGTLNIAWRTA